MSGEIVFPSEGILLERLERARESMAAKGADACLVFCIEGSNWENVFFLSGFRGSHSALLITMERALLVTDGRYVRQAESQSPLEVLDQGSGGLVNFVKGLLPRIGLKKVAIEKKRISHFLALSLAEGNLFEWMDGDSFVEELRREKSIAEADLIKNAGEICSAALQETLPFFRPGVTEREIASRLDFSIRMNGAESTWGDHEFIVASGLRSVLPHGTPTGKALENGEWVTVDFGARLGGYLCDITRNVAVGRVPVEATLIHELLQKAQEEAFRLVRPGVKALEVDGAARRLIDEAGYGEAFSHGLGHGLGLELHERPWVSRNSGDTLRTGDVITLEPGIYLPGFGGLRVEDDCLVTRDGAQWLTRSTPSGFLQGG